MPSSKPWWRTDVYDDSTPYPDALVEYEGPKGAALVKTWPDGRTDPGWGLNPPRDSNEGFMPRYMRGEFNARRVLFGFNRGKWNFAFVMRSLSLVVIDVDGKNNGFTGAKRLGVMAPTLSEVSKSGNGYHLFYSFAEEWHPDLGFGTLSDRIGIEEGVDVRATGCVFHNAGQLWNNRAIAPLPDHLADLLKHREDKLSAQYVTIAETLAEGDTTEVLLMQDQLMSDLLSPIPAGRRNQTLFAIGNKMRAAQVPQWEDHLRSRALAVGLPQDEADKLVANIQRYGAKTPTP